MRATPSPRPPDGGTTQGLLRVAVFGSCMTRDNFNRRFNPGYTAWYQVVGSRTPKVRRPRRLARLRRTGRRVTSGLRTRLRRPLEPAA